ncbi:autotransporter domain-containing protein [Bordetella genomosp. 5]|uniref:autotransporter domain-containing protein n=1 Tax=Bordetella genomosp. 5 TaxID=1395608 RepID=UPI0015958AFC|nr:autotransporter domain-containing protein [Bordetella genomosp. 5]
MPPRYPTFLAPSFALRPLTLALAAALSLTAGGTAVADNLLVGDGGNGGAADFGALYVGGGGGGGIGGGGGGGGYQKGGGRGGGMEAGGAGGGAVSGVQAIGGSGAIGGRGGDGTVAGSHGAPVLNTTGQSPDTSAGAGGRGAATVTLQGLAIFDPLGQYDYVGVGGGGGGGGGFAAGGAGTFGTMTVNTGTIAVSRSMFVGGAGGGEGGAYNLPATAGGDGGTGELSLHQARMYIDGSLYIGGAGGGGFAGGRGGIGTVTLTGGSTLQAGVSDPSASIVVGGGTNGGAGILNVSQSTVAISGANQRLLIQSNGVLNIGNATRAGATSGGISTSNAITNHGQINFNQQDAAYEFSPSIEGSGSVTVNGFGYTRLTGTNVHTGGTTVRSGSVLQIGNGTSGSVAGDIVNQGSVVFRRTDDVTYAGQMSGGGLLVKDQGGTLTLTGDNTMTGGIRIDGGTLALAGTGARLGSAISTLDTAYTASSNLALSDGAVLTTSSAFIGRQAGASLVSAITVEDLLTTWNTQSLVLGHASAGELTIRSRGRVQGGNAIIGDTARGTVSIEGSGSSLEMANTFVIGNVPNSVGTVNLRNGATLQTSVLRMGANGGAGHLTLTRSGAGDAPVVLASQIIRQGGASAATIDVDGGIFRVLSAQPLFSGFSAGDITIGAGGMTLDNNGRTDVHIATPLAGAGRLTLVGGGSFSLTLPNTHTGGTSVEDAALVVWGANLLGPGNLTVQGSGIVDLRDSQNVSSLAGTGAIFGSAANLLTVGSDNTSSTFSGQINGVSSLRKVGTGTLTLSGTNAYVGSTAVDAGTLYVSGSSAQSNFTIGNGATLSGTGRVGSVTAQLGGTLDPGAANANLRVDGSLSLLPGSTLVHTLGAAGTTPSLGASSHLAVAGNVSLNGTLALRDPAALAGPGYYRLISYGGSLLADNLTVPGTFAGQPLSVVSSLPGFIDLRLGSVGSDQLQTWSGGSGTWSDTSLQWTNENGNVAQPWGAKTAVFNAAGGGTITVEGNQAFDSLQFVADGYRLESAVHGNGTLGGLDVRASGGAVSVLAGVSADIGAVIGGAGGLDKTGDGTLVLSGSNIYQGETRLSGGTLAVASDASLGTAGALRFEGGALRILGNQYASTGRAMHWSAVGGGFDVDDVSHTFTVGQDLVGGGNLVKRGAGTLMLTGANSYGNTVIEAGTLVGNADSISGAVANDGTVVFDQISNATRTNDVLGAGTFSKRGMGTLLLQGDARQQSWRVEAGELGVIANRFAGNADLSAGATLRLDGAIDATYADRITGSGTLLKQGAGGLALTGDSSSFAGHTDVQAGTLSVGIAGAGKLGGTLAIGDGATLQGTGQVGSTTLMSGATIAPGNSIGTLTVAGDLTFAPGSTYRVEADPASSLSDRIDVSGTARLAGSVVHVGTAGGFSSTQRYTILTANQIQGTFSTVASDYAFLTPALAYDAQQVTLELARKQVDGGSPNPPNPTEPGAPPTPTEPGVPTNPGNPTEPGTPRPPTRPIAFADAAISGNQRATARALDTLPTGSALHEYILTLPNGAPPAVFDSLSGEAHAGIAGTLMGLGSTVRSVPLNRLRANLNAGMRAGAPMAQAGSAAMPASGLPASGLPASNALPAWAELVGNWQTISGNDNNAEVRQRTTGVFIGTDQPVGNGWRVGGALGYTDGKSRVDGRASQADVSSYSAALYGGKSFEAGRGRLNVMAGAAYTWHDISTERTTSVAGATEKLSADYGASTAQVFTELGYEIAVSDRASVEPFVGLSYSDLRTRGFNESGGLAALSGRGESQDQVASTVGLRGRTTFKLGSTEGTLRGSLGWRHAFGDVTPQTTMAFDGSQAFTVAGAPIARDAAIVEFGADVAVSRAATIGVSYSGQYGNGSREHAGSLNLRWRY